MNKYGTPHEIDGLHTLRFERFFSHHPEKIFRVIINPDAFAQWYPFATGEMDIKLGGKIEFDDGEGTTYQGTITELEQPYLFGFDESGEQIDIELKEEGEGCQLVFKHTFNDDSWAVQTAAGWHQCLDVLEQIVNGETVQWADNAPKLREVYSEAFGKE